MLHIQDLIENIKSTTVPEDRKRVLAPLIDYIIGTQINKELTQLNFICTHNSRRSQFSQVWAQIAANHFGVKAKCYSAGVEVTACNERTVESLKRFGLIVNSSGVENPKYLITYSKDSPPVLCFSKLFSDKSSPTKDFAVIMTCADANENCPVIPSAKARLPIRYEDPKKYDDTRLEEIMYDERSMQIASEMFWVFKNV
ncbi:MAG: arsenate reductase [Glaciecola sp.]|jgi:arsenate reductase